MADYSDTLVSIFFASIAARNAAYDACECPNNWIVEPKDTRKVYTSMGVARKAQKHLAVTILTDLVPETERSIEITEAGFGMFLRVGRLSEK